MARIRSAARVAVDVATAGTKSLRQRNDLIIAPAAAGSLGDELLVRGAASLMPAGTRVANWSMTDLWPAPTDEVATLALRASRRIGGAWMPAVSRAWSSAVFIGADVLDGSYNLKNLVAIDLLDAVAARGRPAAVVGFSFSERPRSEMVERLVRVSPEVEFVARGEVSAARFRSSTGRECAVAPDLSWAYLAPWGSEDHGSHHPTQSSQEQIGVNLSGPIADRYGPDVVLDLFEEVSNHFLGQGFELVALPHDFRGDRSDLVLLEELAARVELRLDVRRTTGAAVWTEASRCSAVLSCRMHLAIVALAHGVPVVALGYQDKFDDLTVQPDLGPRLQVIDGDVSVDALVRAVERATELGPLTESELARSRRGRREALEQAFERLL